jgi:hypothetical protein
MLGIPKPCAFRSTAKSGFRGSGALRIVVFIRKNTYKSPKLANPGDLGASETYVFSRVLGHVRAVLCVVVLSRVFVLTRVFTCFLAHRSTRDIHGTQHVYIGVPRGFTETPRSPKWTPEGPPRKPHGTFTDIQEAHKNTRKTRDGQDLTKDWRNIFKKRGNTYKHI